MKLKRIWLITLSFFILLCITGCRTEKTSAEETTPPPAENNALDFSDYVIVRSDFTDSAQTQPSIELKKSFAEHRGYDLALATDWQTTSETAPLHEIIMGKAEREEYDIFLSRLKIPEESCAYGMVGEKLVFYAADTDRMLKIVEKFTQDVLMNGEEIILEDGEIYEYLVSEQLIRKDGGEIMSQLKQNRMIGINAHQKGYPAYGEAYTETYIRLAAEMGSTIYRINYNPTDDSMVKYIRDIADSCHAYGMKIMLVLDRMDGTADEIYARMAYTAEKLADCIDYFQIFNETDIWCSQTDDNTFYNVSDWTGMSQGYYNPERVEICVEKMGSAISAFRETAPEAQLVVNIGSRHYPMLDWYVEAGLSWDIIAFDIYDLDVWDHARFFDKMARRYPGYDFMVAECNYPANSGPFTDEQQADWLSSFLKILDDYESERMIGIIIYELMDQPNYETDGNWNGESHFGIVSTNADYSPGEPKLAYCTVQKMILGEESSFEEVFERVE